MFRWLTKQVKRHHNKVYTKYHYKVRCAKCGYEETGFRASYDAAEKASKLLQVEHFLVCPRSRWYKGNDKM